MKKTIEIEGKSIEFTSNGATPFHYRKLFQRDLIADMQSLGNKAQKGNFETADFSMIEMMAFTMAKQSDPSLDDIEKWLEQFDNPFALYNAVIELISLWEVGATTSSKPKKK